MMFLWASYLAPYLSASMSIVLVHLYEKGDSYNMQIVRLVSNRNHMNNRHKKNEFYRAQEFSLTFQLAQSKNSFVEIYFHQILLAKCKFWIWLNIHVGWTWNHWITFDESSRNTRSRNLCLTCGCQIDHIHKKLSSDIYVSKCFFLTNLVICNS